MSTEIPLTHFEELMLHQDCPAYPASCFVRLRFQGRLQPDEFESAAKTTIARHPLLHSTVEKLGQKHVWCEGVVAPKITWNDTDDQPYLGIGQLDVTANHGLHFHVRLWQDQSEVLIQFHHACCDGIAIYQVVRDLLMAYAAEFPNERNVALPPIDDTLLKTRASSGRRGRAFLKLVLNQAARLPHVWNFFARTPAQLVPHDTCDNNAAAPEQFPGLISQHFDTATSKALRNSLELGVTLNDLLMRDLFLTIRDFRKLKRTGDKNHWLRLMIPTNLRQPAQYRAPAANTIGAVFLDRRASGMDDHERLLHGIRNEMDQVKQLELGHLFDFSLFAQSLVPGVLRRAAHPKRCCVTAVFTNIGRVLTRCALPRVDGRWQSGNVVLLTTEAAAPIARNVCASFSATWYAGGLSLSLHYDQRAMSPSAANILLGMLTQRVEISAGVRGTETQEPVPTA